MQRVDVYLAGTDDLLLGIMIDLSKASDSVLNDILVTNLCGHEKPFCSHCFGGDITFEITRCCDHKITIWPHREGKKIESLDFEEVNV